MHEGIILGGLEWTEQPLEMEYLIQTALDAELQVMLYTHLDYDTFVQNFPSTAKLPIWIKFGEYKQELEGILDSSGIQLASENQFIMFMGDVRDDI